jgi:hypothetical protein
MAARRLGLVAVIALAGCGAEGSNIVNDANSTVDGGGNDAPGACQVDIGAPANPVAGPGNLRLVAQVSNGGVLTYHWQVTHNGQVVAVTSAQADGSQVDLVATDPGVYHVQLDVGATTLCPTGQLDLNVLALGAQLQLVRLRAFAPASDGSPPQERTFQVPGGATEFAAPSWSLDPGLVANGQVISSTAGVAAYLRFMPTGKPDDAVETFSAADGSFVAQVLDGTHDVLVVPMVAGVAPRLIHGWTIATQSIQLDAGVAVAGVVRGPSGAALAGAKVRFTVDGVPSTLATTAADGSFTVALEPSPGALITLEVVPPASSGLPRLGLASSVIDLTKSVQVRYGAVVTTRNVGGTKIQRGAATLPAARVTIVGALAAIGTVTTATSEVASGTTSLALVTDAAGKLPSALAPAGPLTAVIEATPGDVALAALDLTAGVPATVDAPPMITATGRVASATGASLGGAQLTATPLGALALAGIPARTASAAADGTFALPLASGGHVALRVLDPAGRGAALELADVTAVPATLNLPAAVRLSGTLLGRNGKLIGAAVQVLCGGCTGVARTRPLAEAATNISGDFVVAVPDAGATGHAVARARARR